MSDERLRALGTIVKARSATLSESQFYCGVFDYYDHWSEIDPRLASHHNDLSTAAGVFGHDLVNLATYAHHILYWLDPDHIVHRECVVAVGAMTESFIVSVRSACDAIAGALAYRASSKPNQAPSFSLRALIDWARDNPSRVNPIVAPLLLGDSLKWFWELRTLRDYIVHSGANATIHCNGRQFNLWVSSPKVGWITRQPLLPLLAETLNHMVAFGDQSAHAINQLINLPTDRLRSRFVEGFYVPALHSLIRVANQYADPSP